MFAVNLLGTLHLLDAARKLDAAPAIQVCGSSSEYAPNPAGRPIGESAQGQLLHGEIEAVKPGEVVLLASLPRGIERAIHPAET